MRTYAWIDREGRFIKLYTGEGPDNGDGFNTCFHVKTIECDTEPAAEHALKMLETFLPVYVESELWKRNQVTKQPR